MKFFVLMLRRPPFCYKKIVYPIPRAPIDQYIARRSEHEKNCFKAVKRRDLHKKKFRGGRNRDAGGDANQVFFYLALSKSALLRHISVGDYEGPAPSL